MPHELSFTPDGWSLRVPEASVPAALAQLRRWEIENARVAVEPPLRRRSTGVDGAIAWALWLVGFWLAQRERGWGLDWEAAGTLDAARLRAGEVWRAVTALLLHADPAHLGGNVVFGALLAGALCWLLGTGAGLLVVLIAGAAGNAAAAWLRGTGLSLGASTAAFAALGAIAALAWRRRAALLAARRRATPLIGALLLLGYLGTEGERVDVLGHACGFLAGAALGAVLGMAGALQDGAPLARALDRRGWQWVAGLAAAALLSLAWWRALA